MKKIRTMLLAVWTLLAMAVFAVPSMGAEAEGKWTSETDFVNTWSDYRLVFPAGYANEVYSARYQNDIHDFSVSSPHGDIFAQAVYRDTGAAVDSQALDTFSRQLSESLQAEMGFSFGGSSDLELGVYGYRKLSFTLGDMIREDVYLRPVGNHVMILDVLYFGSSDGTVGQILGSQKRVSK